MTSSHAACERMPSLFFQKHFFYSEALFFMMEIRLFNLSSGYKNEPEVSQLSVQILFKSGEVRSKQL